jgi:hypothetical protein
MRIRARSAALGVAPGASFLSNKKYAFNGLRTYLRRDNAGWIVTRLVDGCRPHLHEILFRFSH